MATAEEISKLKEEAQTALKEAEFAWYKYFSATEIGEERLKASMIYENVRNAGRVY